MIKPKDLICRHCINSAPPTMTDYEGYVHVWCRLGPYPNRVEADYWCKQGYWIVNKTDDTGKTAKLYYSREDMFFVSNVEGKIVDPWKE